MRVFNDTRIAAISLVALMWFAFLACGACVRDWVASSHVEGVLGYDYLLYISQLSDPVWIFYTGVRHPGLGVVMSPVVLLGKTISLFGRVWQEWFILAVFATVATANTWLIRKMAGWKAAAIFLCFGWTWILSAVPESFPVAMMSLLLVVMLIRSSFSGKARWCAWGLLFVLCSAITITNGLKVVIAFLLTEKCPKGLKRIVVLGLLMVAVLGVGFFYVRMECWNVAHPEAQKTVAGALAQTLSWIPDGLGVWGRIKAGVVNFFIVPVLPFAALPLGEDVTLRSLPSVGMFGWVCGGAIYTIALVSLWYMRDSDVVRAMLGMFLVDVVIHLVCGWGVQEGWIFSAHWFYMLPIGIGLAWQKLKRHSSLR